METSNNNKNFEEMYYPQSPTRFNDDDEEIMGESLFITNNNSSPTRNPFDMPTTSTISGLAPSDSYGMDFTYMMNQEEESILPPQPQLSACSHSYPDNINEFSVENLDELMPIGKVFNVVEKKITIEVIVDKNSKVHDLVSQNNVNLRENNSLDPEMIRKQLKLQVGALLFTKEGKPIGKITDIFGTVTKPFYVLTYPDISTMRAVFNIPQESNTTSTTESASKKEETAQPPSTPTKQKTDKFSTPKKTPGGTTETHIDDFFDIPDPRDLKVIELKPYLQRRGLSPWGKKKNLIAKIRKFERDKRKNQQNQKNEDSEDNSSSSDSDSSSSSDEEGESLFTPKKKESATLANGEKFALRTLKDLEGMESDEEEHETKKDDKKTNNSSAEKLSQSEIARIKGFGLIYCHNVISAKLDETSTHHMILNHTKAYDAMFNSDEKTEVMTFSDDEDESAFKHQKKEERKTQPPPILKRKFDEAIQPSTTSSSEDQVDTPTKVSKKLPFIDISEAKQQEKTNTIETVTTEATTTEITTQNDISIPSASVEEEEPKPQINNTPKQTTKPTPNKTRSTTKPSSAARKPRVRQSTAIVQTTQDEEPSFFTKYCLIM